MDYNNSSGEEPGFRLQRNSLTSEERMAVGKNNESSILNNPGSPMSQLDLEVALNNNN